MDKDLFLEIPEGYELSNELLRVPRNQLALPVLKGLYGFKQSAKLWNDTLKKVLEEEGLIQNRFEPAIFSKHHGEKLLVVSIYVDDLVIASTEEDWLESLEKRLRSNFKLTTKNEETITEVLGIKIEHQRDSLKLSQPFYIEEKVKKFQQDTAKNEFIPMEAVFRSDSCDIVNAPYLELIGSLRYAAKTTRPDITFAYSGWDDSEEGARV
jgi:hypothetical protein